MVHFNVRIIETLTVRDSLFRPLVTKEKPCVSMATPVRCMCSSTYLRAPETHNYYNSSRLPTWQKNLTCWQGSFYAHNKLGEQRLLLLLCEQTYQLINELFPAEWLPMSWTMIFFRGASSFSPRLSAMRIKPVDSHKKKKTRIRQRLEPAKFTLNTTNSSLVIENPRAYIFTWTYSHISVYN